MAISPRIALSGAPTDPTLEWRILLWLCIATTVLSALTFTVNLIDVLAPSAFYGDDIASSVLLSIYFLLDQIGLVAALATFGAILWVTHRLARNLHALAPGAFTMSPTLAMAWYIVPIANLVMPPQVIDRVARTTSAAAGVAHEPATTPGWWWAAFVASALLGNVATVVLSNPNFGGETYVSAMWTSAVSAALGVAAYLLTIRVFGPIARLQASMVSDWRKRQAAASA